MKTHTFHIQKDLPTSMGNLVANYLDLEHVYFHQPLTDPVVLYENRNSACFLVSSRLGPLRTRTFHYYEYLPPDQFRTIAMSRFGPMHVLSRFTEHMSGTPQVHTVVDVETTLHLSRFWWPFRRWIEAAARKFNHEITEEDAVLLARRRELFGSWVGDFGRDWQPLLMKDLFLETFADKLPASVRPGSSTPES